MHDHLVLSFVSTVDFDETLPFSSPNSNCCPHLCLSVCPSPVAIYNIVSQRQMTGRSDADFSPNSNVVPITVQPTQNAAKSSACCQNN